VTPLINKALPLLRYRVHDRVKLGPVDAHWPFKRIEQIIGRSTMCYVFKTPERRVFIGTNFLFFMDEQQEVAIYQFRQTGPDAVECLFVPQPSVDVPVLQQQLESLMRRCLDDGDCTSVKCSARMVAQLSPDPRTGKVEQNVPLADETA